MSGHATSTTTPASAVRLLKKPCLVRLASYRQGPEVVQELANWTDSVNAPTSASPTPTPTHAEPVDPPFALVKKFNEVLMLYDQVNFAPRRTAEALSHSCLEAAASRPLPTLDRIGLTHVVSARCSADADRHPANSSLKPAAHALLTALTGHETGILRGGPLSPDVELWSWSDDPDWLILLCHDTDEAEQTADSLLVGPLWNHEVAYHKAADQFQQFLRLRKKRLEPQLKALSQSIDTLSAVYENPRRQADSKAELLLSSQVTQARRRLNSSLGLASKMQISLETHQANLLANRQMLGPGPGLEALELRRLNLDQWIAQVRAKIAYARPELEAALDICAIHRTDLMEAGNELEKEENRQRDASGKMFALLGLWIGLLSFFSGLWATEKNSPYWGPLTFILMLACAIIGILGVTFWWFSSRSQPPAQTPNKTPHS